jgi:hypothetical protein
MKSHFYGFWLNEKSRKRQVEVSEWFLPG